MTHRLWPFQNKIARDVQLEALEAAEGKEGFAFFMRQRLGKTWTAFAEFTNLREQGLVDWCVIICPNTLKEQWVNAIQEVNEYIPICVYESSAKAKVDYFFKKNKKGGVLIINYESMKAFMEAEYWNKFQTLRTYVVADESTKIKDPSKKSSKACLEFASICSYKRVLTGKPTANSNADIWAQLKFINATTRNFYQHKYYFCVMGGYMGRSVVKNVNETILRNEIAPYSYVAPDKYIKGFEKVYEPLRRIDLLAEQRNQYKSMEDSLLLELGGEVEITAPIALTKYLRLQQISSGIAGDIDGLQHNLIDPNRNPRIKAVKDILENECSNKVIIVCRFKLSITNLKRELEKDGHKCAIMIGGMGIKLEDEKLAFNTHSEDALGAKILIAQTQVLNFGHNLAGPDDDPCDSVIYYENDFSLINRAQTESRCEKYGRDGAVSYYDFYASKMDRAILQALIRKEDASMALMGYARNRGLNIDMKQSENAMF